MSNSRFLTYAAVFAIIIENNRILLQRRSNSVIDNNLYDMAASGHVEKGETLKEAMCRELKEEIGITVLPDHLQFATLGFCYYDTFNTTYHNTYFLVTQYNGSPKICEPHKISELKWFELSHLPSNLSSDRLIALQSFLNQTRYFEYGFSC